MTCMHHLSDLGQHISQTVFYNKILVSPSSYDISDSISQLTSILPNLRDDYEGTATSVCCFGHRRNDTKVSAPALLKLHFGWHIVVPGAATTNLCLYFFNFALFLQTGWDGSCIVSRISPTTYRPYPLTWKRCLS